MKTGLKDKVAIITGGASGIGKATVLKLAEEGAIPVFIDNNKKEGEKLGYFLLNKKQAHRFIFAELTNDEECREAIEKTIKDYHKIDILINNAGRNDRVDVDAASPDEFRKSLDKNLVHYYTMTHYSWPFLKQSKGNIVFVGSKVSLVGEGRTTAYAAAKGAINGMTRELATKSCNENLGIRVNCVLPGIVKTQLFDEYVIKECGSVEKGIEKFCKDIPLGQRPTTPDEIANTIIYLASDLSSHMTGQLIVPDGGYCNIDRSIKTDF
jgi:L-fucose dehydrogenase